MQNIVLIQQYRHLSGHGHRIIDQHEFLQGLMPQFIVGHRLHDKQRVTSGGVGFRRDFHLFQIKHIPVLGGAFLAVLKL